MSRINGIGTAFFGHSEPQRDGSYVATKWFCVVIPLIPLGSFRLWPEGHSSYGFGTYSSTTFRANSQGLYLPHLLKIYGMYAAFYGFLVLAERMSSGEWHFS